MDQNGRQAVQVVINGHSQVQRPHGPMHVQNQPRPLSVDEALQYSSMSSAPVFGLGLSTPQILLRLPFIYVLMGYIHRLYHTTRHRPTFEHNFHKPCSSRRSQDTQ